MQKFPLSAIGFECLQNNLYKLSDVELAEIAIQIRSNFIMWLGQNFDLNEPQIKHLKSLRVEVIEELYSQTAIAIQGRLPIKLLKPEIKPVVGYDSKLIRSVSKVYELASYDDSYEAEGELVIQISY